MLCHVLYQIPCGPLCMVGKAYSFLSFFLLTRLHCRKLSGMAIRHCIELGYHRSTGRFRPIADALSNEMSKRVFWVSYDMDRVAAFTLGRPFGINDDEIDVEVGVAREMLNHIQF